MTSIAVPCPKCKKKLKLRDESLLGKKVRCPNCKHSFVLKVPAAAPASGSSTPQPQQTEPSPPVKPPQKEEIKIELAEPDAPVVGTSAKWIPDEPAESPAPAAITPPPQTDSFPQIDTSGSNTKPPEPSAPVIDTSGSGSGLPNLQLESSEHAGVSRLRELRRKNAKRRNMTILIGLALILIIGVGGYFAWPEVEQTLATNPPAPAPAKPAPAKPVMPASLVSRTQEKIASPTAGEPVRLLYVPAGTRILFHLRPAALWSPGSQGEEFRACLGPIGIWVDQKIREICMREPGEIEELTFCLMPGSPGTPPEYAAVVRTTEPFRRSELITRFDGQQLEGYSFPVYYGDQHSYMIVDDHTFVVGPPGQDRATEMAESREFESSTTPGMESMLKQTDRDRHLTVVFDPDEVRRQLDVLLPEKAHAFMNELLDWIGEDVETIAWSMHLGQNDFFSELTFRNSTMIRAPKLASNLKAQLDQLPHDMLTGVEKMNPGTVGSRKVIGRFPAMLKAFSMANQQQSGERYAQLTSRLPERAAPNLALASLLTWDESTRTDFSAKAKPKTPSGPKLPDKVVDRLKLKLEVDIRRMPLQEVFAYIADETKTNIILEGEALKLVGYTKNMPQTMNLGMVSGLDAIQAIFNVKDQDQMCLVIDEAKKTATITSKPYAKQNNLKPFEFPPKP